MKDTEGDEQEDDWADQTMHWTQASKRTTVANKQYERVPESHKKESRKGQKRLKKEVTEVKREVKERDTGRMTAEAKSRGRTLSALLRPGGTNCPGTKHKNQASKATTAMMAWMRHARDLYRWLTTRFEQRTVRFRMADGRSVKVTREKMLQEKKTEGLYRLEGVSRQEELLSDIGPVVLARRMDEESNRAQRYAKQAQGYQKDVLEGSGVVQECKRCFGIRVEVWPDTRRCNQCRMSMKKLRGERQSRYEEKRRKEERDALTALSEKAAAAARSRRWRLSMVKNGGTNELSHELIFSALRPIN
ncbi:hypothetical protein Acr_00g0055380 [Actinidia rufa]|uniref:Uncharacterized protein n=1 Tax=Actinidia rufa TaxID=165716 RepID=A0A7J0DMH2_9ERIC|nr:hypothetical protein Acr_00g0055380 [Actinidia rufa]